MDPPRGLRTIPAMAYGCFIIDDNAIKFARFQGWLPDLSFDQNTYFHFRLELGKGSDATMESKSLSIHPMII
jgi:hypothetical protein